MTGLLPYDTKKRDIAINNAITNAMLPADLSHIAAPEYIQPILEKCWQQEPQSRPTIVCCREMLPPTVTSLQNLLQQSFAEIPDFYKAQGDGWNAVCNPDLGKTYECDFLPTLIYNETW